MNDDMSSMIDNLKQMLENGDLQNNINSIMGNQNNKSDSNSENNNENSNSNNIDPEMIQNMFNMFNNSSTKSSNQNDTDNQSSNNFNIDMETLLKMKNIIDKVNTKEKDPRSNLLLSLKPYLKESRKDKIEQYIQFLNMAKIMDVFNPTAGGDKPK